MVMGANLGNFLLVLLCEASGGTAGSIGGLFPTHLTKINFLIRPNSRRIVRVVMESL